MTLTGLEEHQYLLRIHGMSLLLHGILLISHGIHGEARELAGLDETFHKYLQILLND